MKIVFMGTPAFAVPSLRAMVEAGHEVAGVFTQPDKKQGRHMTLVAPPVKEYALTQDIPVYQPDTLKDGAALCLLQDLAPELIVVVAYGKLLPVDILGLPVFGCVNVHASLLPRLRGAAPIQWAVIRGEEKTGVTTMHMARGLDTGDMIYKEETPIGPRETAGELHDRLMELGAALLIKTVADIAAGTAPRTPQDDAEATYAPMLSRDIAHINWSLPARAVVNFIRGMSPWPAALAGQREPYLKIFEAVPVACPQTGQPGTVFAADGGFGVFCGGGEAVLVTKIQAHGGRPMPAEDYVRGHRLEGEML